MLRFSLAIATVYFLYQSSAVAGPRVIYGPDGRHETCEDHDVSHMGAARSTLAVIPDEVLRPERDDSFEIVIGSFKKEYSLCEDEPYADEPVAADCTAFLVARDKIVTAGHCLENHSHCPKASFVFDYANASPFEPPTRIQRAQAYRCVRVIAHREGPEIDFAVIKLDRPVEDREPLLLRRGGHLERGDEVFMVGHPVGLPQKITTGAFVRESRPHSFIANLDSYGGNSGSPVFNAKTGEVEGLLVSGEDDFDEDDLPGLDRPAEETSAHRKCKRSRRCDDNRCSGETVSAISSVLRFL